MPLVTDVLGDMPHCRLRDEEDGAVVYVPATGRYFYATAAGAELCRLVEDGRPGDEVIDRLAATFGLPATVVADQVIEAVDVLRGPSTPPVTARPPMAANRPAGARPSVGPGPSVGANGDGPGDPEGPGRPWVVPLEQKLGPGAQRCETFGMPL